MNIHIIAAIGKNRELGKDNKLLWKSKSDLQNFKNITNCHPLIMGRKTFESLPGILPNRPHFVITKSNSITTNLESGVIVYSDVDIAIKSLKLHGCNDLFVIGGGEIYKQLLPHATHLHITRMDWTGDADTYFPDVDYSMWNLIGTKVSNPDDTISWEYTEYIKN